jgi:hypothetical protein
LNLRGVKGINFDEIAANFVEKFLVLSVGKELVLKAVQL